MRNIRIAYRAIALAAVIAVSATGQQVASQALPGDEPYALSTIDLPLEPLHDAPAPTLAQSAAQNDFPQFDRLYHSASAGETAAYAELHRFWEWSLEDPTGAFYGQETHDRLAARYPGFAAYIDGYRLADAHGRLFYPSSETRRYLLTEATAADVPREAAVLTAVATGAEPVQSAAAPSTSTSLPQRHPAGAAKQARTAIAVPAIPARTETPDAVPVPVARTVAPAVLPRAAQTPAGTAAQPVESRNAIPARALLLTILGLVGVGVITLLLQAPGEEQRPPSSSVA